MQNKEPFFHKSVLVQEVIHYLDPVDNGVYIDATFGSGGHTRALLESNPTCRVYGLDWDNTSLDKYAPLIQEEFGDRFIPIWGNFAHLYKLIKKYSIKPINGILADFGTSQMQIFERPGFSFRRDTPLDMRMSAAHQKITAADVVNESTVYQLIKIFKEFGEERSASRIARAIDEYRAHRPIKTTSQLAQLIEKVVPRQHNKAIHPATRVFQALRIYVNKELENITAFLNTAVRSLALDGRLVCISFHSLEDRLVKQLFRSEKLAGNVELLTPKAIEPSEDEIRQNPSSRSSKLRALKKIV